MRAFLKNDIIETLLLFIAWRIWITVFAMGGIILLQPQSRDFFGGGFSNYLDNPMFWGWSNFDGEHYVSIAQKGYSALTHAFFPGFPTLLKLISVNGINDLVIGGTILASILFLLSLVFLRRLVQIDYSSKVARWTIVILMLWPASFFFGSVYVGSLLLFLVVLSFYFARTSKWFISGLVGAVASATHIFGIVLLPGVFIEWLSQGLRKSIKRSDLNAILGISLISGGLLCYGYYLYKTTGDPLSFYTEQAHFAQGRTSDKLILLPQVFWRYVKMILTVDKSSSTYFVIWTEFLTAIIGTLLLVVGFLKRVRPSYLIFAAVTFVLPHLTGNFTSLPRYVTIIFPLFIIASLLIQDKSNYIKLAVVLISLCILALQTMMFISGYWVA